MRNGDVQPEGVVRWVSCYRDEFLLFLVGLPDHVRPVAWLCAGQVDGVPEVPDLERFGWRHRSALSSVVPEERYTAALP
ncbi:hypothetical protein OG801_07090 [Nocardioides sp. NBC_00163]|uniref:hypothetical protein n=1 Tax=Nocardioides sp. NBC_00163 TaxID=2975999 RepID=UPI003247B618